MPNYQNGKIYKITSGDLIYIGSTTQSLAKRWGDHNKDLKYGNNLPFHKLIVDIKDTITYNVTNVPTIKFLVNLFSFCINSKLF